MKNETPSLLPSVSSSPTTAPLLSLEEILNREMPINWDEAVAVVEEVCALLTPVETGVPRPSNVLLADDAVVLRDGARGESDVSGAGRLLHSLLSTAAGTPVPLRLFVTQASAQGTYATVGDFAKALAYFGKANRRDLIRALYLRCAGAPSALATVVRPTEPARNAPPETTAPPTRPRRSIPRWAIAACAAIVVSAAGVWGWSMLSRFAPDAMLPSLVDQAREVVGRLRIGSAAEPPPSSPPVAEAPQPTRHAATGGRPGAVLPDAPRLISRTIGSPGPAPSRSRRQPRPPLPVLVQPPSSAELSARSADETAREAILHTVYSGRDEDVDPPVLLYPQIPANLMLAGENRLNIMELLISEAGSVEQVRLIAGPSRLPDVMLLSGAKAWRFKPAARDGEAVRYRALVSWAGTP